MLMYNVKTNDKFNEDFLRLVLNMRTVQKVSENNFLVECNEIDAEVLRQFGCKVRKIEA